MLALTVLFLAISFSYAIVGFGGGSSYIAMLAATGVSYSVIPKISLICNLLVAFGGTYHYVKSGHLSWKLMLPFVLSSVPMAFVGGLFPLREKTFFILLTCSLLVSGARLLFLPDRKSEEIKPPSLPASIAVGSFLGLLSGMVGIGGGIFLSPLLINMGWARSKNAAALASAFILLNSVAGLCGQFAKNPGLAEMSHYLPLFIAVIVGGQLGSRLGTHRIVSYVAVQKGTGLLTLFISLKLLLNLRLH